MKTMKKKVKEQREEPSFIHLDENTLDLHWLEQPRLIWRTATKLADAKKDQSEAKAELDVVKAELTIDITSDPSKYGAHKITVDVMKSLVIQQEEYKVAQKVLIQIEHRIDLLQAQMTALEHRKRALEGLITLHGQSYFASSPTKKATREGMDDMERKRMMRRLDRDDVS